MNRTEFEALRAIPGKVIRGDIRFSRRQATRPALTAEGIVIESLGGIELRLNITYNPEVGAKTFNVCPRGGSPICRLDVDGPAHRPAGRSHKHSLQSERCPDRNLPDRVIDRPDLSGRSVRELFAIFCQMGHILHEGAFLAPDENES
jgi:hypothetical protein